MKKHIALLLAAAILLSIAGCAGKGEKIQSPVSMYYLRSEFTYNSIDSVVASEIRDAASFENEARTILSAYLLGPQSDDLRSPFPKNTRLLQLTLTEDTAQIILTNAIATLRGIHLTLACVCLARTVMELTGVQKVQISADSEMLGGNKSIIIDSSSVHLTESTTK